MTPREHGGGLDAAAVRYGHPRETWLDLSTGINPDPYPVPPLPSEVWQRLPDRTMLAELRSAAAACYGVSDPCLVVPTPGSQAAIQWLPWVLEPTRVAVLSPTYNEHAPAWTVAGHLVTEVNDLDDAGPDTAVFVVVNPNNPDGRRVSPEQLLDLSRTRRVVVDEAFVDTEPDLSVARHVGDPDHDLVVLRSLGKFFGLAGLRLGFALAAEEQASLLETALGPWAVSGPACLIGTSAVSDTAWRSETRRRLADRAVRLDALLAGAGVPVVGGTDLFRLVEDSRAGDLHEHLARAGILTRAFGDDPYRLRLGLPRLEDEGRLTEALAAFAERTSASATVQNEIR